MFPPDVARGSIRFSRVPVPISRRLKSLERQADLDESLMPLAEATKLMIEEATGYSENAFNCRYHFDVVNQDGKRLYHISESSVRLAHVFGILPARLQFAILDAEGKVLLLVSGYDSYCGHPNDFSIESISGHFGHILQKSAFVCGKPKFYVCNQDQEVIFRVNSDQFVECMRFGAAADFRILKKNNKGTEYGILSKFPPYPEKKSAKKANYGVTFFEEDMDIYEKALLMIITVVLHLRFYKPRKDKRAYYYRKTSDVSQPEFEVTK